MQGLRHLTYLSLPAPDALACTDAVRTTEWVGLLLPTSLCSSEVARKCAGPGLSNPGLGS